VTRLVRRMGIAFGSLVAASLILGLVGGQVVMGASAGLVAVALGALIYRDIVRREPRP
jgi:hypothetical protein